jgi:hypothetical protein
MIFLSTVMVIQDTPAAHATLRTKQDYDGLGRETNAGNVGARKGRG